MLLNEERATAFHHKVEQLIFCMSNSSKDIKMAIALLCTRARSPDKDDLGKIVRVIRYIRVTLHIPLIIRADRLSVIKWWVYASFDAHPYCKGNTGSMVSMGSGLIMELYHNQKINGKRSTESKTVAEDDNLPPCLWLR